MYEPFLIVEGSLVETVEGGAASGFAFQARCGYYRRLILSMVEEIAVWLDDEPVAPEDISFELRGRRWSLGEMASEFTQAWEFGEPATILVRRGSPLVAGEHRIRLRERLRISYLPRPDIAETERVETLRSAA